MQAYEAGIKLAKTEFFDKVAAPPKVQQVGAPSGNTKSVKPPAPKAPAPKAPAPKAPAPKAPAPNRSQIATVRGGVPKGTRMSRPAPLKSTSSAQRPAPKPAPKPATRPTRTPATNQTPAPAPTKTRGSVSAPSSGGASLLSLVAPERRQQAQQLISTVAKRENNRSMPLTQSEQSNLDSAKREFLPQNLQRQVDKIQDPKQKQMVSENLRKELQKQQGGSSQPTSTPAPRQGSNTSQISDADKQRVDELTQARNMLSNAFNRISSGAGETMDSLKDTGRNLMSGAEDIYNNMFSSEEEPNQSLPAEEQPNMSVAPSQPEPQFTMPNFENLSLNPNFLGRGMGRSSAIQGEFGQKSEPSFLDNVMGRVGDFASNFATNYMSSQPLRDFEDKQYGTSDAMDDAEFDSMNNAYMDASNQETAAKLEDTPGTLEYEARMEQEEADAIANRFDVQKGGYGRQLRRFREQFGQDDATRELLEGINYRDFASALGNRGLRVGDQIDARDIINRLRQQQGGRGPVDTDSLGAIGIRDSRGRDANRGALGRRRRAAQPRQNTVERPNQTTESPALPSGTSDLTPRERARLYGELDSLYGERDRIFREAGGGSRNLSAEEQASLADANKSIQDYAGLDSQLLPMYRREGQRVRNLNLDPRMLRGRTAPRTGPSARDLINKLRQQGR